MYTTKKIVIRRKAFTLVEMLVVIAIILALAALAAAFAPRVNDNQKMTRAVDNLEQWLLIAKMRAKRDGLSTGLRFIQAPGDPVLIPGPAYSQFQYIQQPEPLSGGIFLGGPSPTPPAGGPSGYPPPYQYPLNSGFWYAGGLLVSALPSGAPGTGSTVTFTGVDFTLGGAVLAQALVQTGDYLEINGGGVFFIQAVTSATTLQLSPTTYGSSFTTIVPTTNYRILRQPRILIGEEPLALPDNYTANFGPIPGYLPATSGCNVALGPSGYPEILFSPSGAVVGTNAGTPILWISVWDLPALNELPDPNRVGIVGIQSRSGFLGAYSVSLGANGPFFFVQSARESGL